MGQSPSADLYYGFDLGDMTDDDYESTKPAWMVDEEGGETRDWEEELASRLGWQEVPVPIGGPQYPRYSSNPAGYEQAQSDYKVATDAFRKTPEYQRWSANCDEMRKIISGTPVELDTYGYSEEPRYCVRVKPSVQRAHDWGSTELKPLEIDPEWDRKITEFMSLLELPVPDGKKPGWHMNCSYG